MIIRESKRKERNKGVVSSEVPQGRRSNRVESRDERRSRRNQVKSIDRTGQDSSSIGRKKETSMEVCDNSQWREIKSRAVCCTVTEEEEEEQDDEEDEEGKKEAFHCIHPHS